MSIKNRLQSYQVYQLPSVFVKRRQPAKIATYFAFCASYFDKLVHRLYYKEVNFARLMTMSAGFSKTKRNPCCHASFEKIRGEQKNVTRFSDFFFLLVNFQNRISPPIVHTKGHKRYLDAGDFLYKMMLILEA